MIGSIISWMWSWFTPFWIGIYMAITAAQCGYTVYSYKKRLTGTPELNKKYWPFRRNDLEHWKFFSGTIICGLAGLPFRYIICWAIVSSISLVVRICCIGHDWISPIEKWRAMLIFKSTAWMFRTLIWFIGVTWVTKERKKVDYSKYLGKDWKPTYEGHGIQISNHVSWIDILALMALYPCSFLSKDSVANYPWIGTIAKGIQCVFIKRGDTKEKRAEAL